jgi:DnaJ-class molecular chaperone
VGFFDRLGGVLRSYLNDGDDWNEASGGHDRRFSGDPDLDRAFEDLEGFLNGRHTSSGGGNPADWNDVHTSPQKKPAVPERLRPDFKELGLEFGAGIEQCKSAYKRLLKIHHPDRHTSHEGNMKKATAKTVKINDAYKHIREWYENGGKQ